MLNELRVTTHRYRLIGHSIRHLPTPTLTITFYLLFLFTILPYRRPSLSLSLPLPLLFFSRETRSFFFSHLKESNVVLSFVFKMTERSVAAAHIWPLPLSQPWLYQSGQVAVIQERAFYAIDNIYVYESNIMGRLTDIFQWNTSIR